MQSMVAYLVSPEHRQGGVVQGSRPGQVASSAAATPGASNDDPGQGGVMSTVFRLERAWKTDVGVGLDLSK